MALMEVPNQGGVQDVPGWNPGAFLWAIILPVHQVLQSAAYLEGVQVLSDRVGGLTVGPWDRCPGTVTSG